MISHQTLLNEIEKHVKNAKILKRDESLREHIIAIRALCDLALATKIDMTFSVPESPQQPAFVESKPSSLTSTKLEENDANGDSIFDF